MHLKRDSVLALVLVAGLAACNQTSEANLTKASQCVDIPDGQYFQFVNGQLVTVTSVEEETREQPIISAQRIGRSLAGQGFPWIIIDWDGQTATISGQAPNEASRIDGFRNAKAAFENDPFTGDDVQRVVNNIELRDLGAQTADQVKTLLLDKGISWLRSDVKGRVVVLSGTAPDAASKQEAFRSAVNAINIALNSDETEFVTVDAITVPGQEEPVGEALLTIETSPSLIECDNALFETMDDQSIVFVENESIVDNASKPLMDALTGIAHLCSAYEIEIRQHASGPSDVLDVMELSERRASAIRDQLSIGGDRDLIVVRGFGNTNPLEQGDTPEARARNQRTEFIVRERAD